MRPISKFCVFFALAGILAILFALLPSDPKDKKTPQPGAGEDRAGMSVEKARQHRSGAVNHQGVSIADFGKVAASAATRVNVPAIRGANNYGWVQLPRGASVDLVRQGDDGVLVSWDGNVFRIPKTAVASGAVVVRNRNSKAVTDS